MPKWEYRMFVIEVKENYQEELYTKLQEFGEKGWELVGSDVWSIRGGLVEQGYQFGPESERYIFKRVKQESEEQN